MFSFSGDHSSYSQTCSEFSPRSNFNSTRTEQGEGVEQSEYEAASPNKRRNPTRPRSSTDPIARLLMATPADSPLRTQTGNFIVTKIFVNSDYS